MEQACREIGARALRLEVELPNEGARRLYRRLGFVAHDRRTMTKRLED
ncbi:MAG: GNAT family N-acetyltransferase [Chloroflexi bacterium]|nr:GNAT family N-acetyltransferase [Chloroflexota bacterium]